MAKKNPSATTKVESPARVALGAYRSVEGDVVFTDGAFDDPDFALEVAGKLATAAHEAMRARAEAVANEELVLPSSAAGAA